MNQKINIRPKLNLRLNTSLRLVVFGTVLVTVAGVILFTIFFTGNNKDATANSTNINSFFLAPVDPLANSHEAQPTFNISSTGDSLYIEFISDGGTPIQDAVLRLKDVNGSITEKNTQTRVMTLFSPVKMNRSYYRFAIPVKGFPENIRIEVKATVSQKAAPAVTKAWVAQMDYNLKASAVTMIYSGVQKAKKK